MFQRAANNQMMMDKIIYSQPKAVQIEWDPVNNEPFQQMEEKIVLAAPQTTIIKDLQVLDSL